MLKKVGILAMLLTVLVLPIHAQAAKAPKLSAKKITLTVGKSKTLTVKADKRKLKNVKWKSSKKSVAVVKKLSKQKAKVTAKKSGKAKITATVGKKKLSCVVTVKKKTAAKYDPKKPITPEKPEEPKPENPVVPEEPTPENPGDSVTEEIITLSESWTTRELTLSEESMDITVVDRSYYDNVKDEDIHERYTAGNKKIVLPDSTFSHARWEVKNNSREDGNPIFLMDAVSTLGENYMVLMPIQEGSADIVFSNESSSVTLHVTVTGTDYHDRMMLMRMLGIINTPVGEIAEFMTTSIIRFN